MRTKTAYLLAVCFSMMCCAATISMAGESADQNLTVEIVPSDSRPADSDPLEMLRDTNKSEYKKSAAKSNFGEVEPASAIESVSLSTLVEKKRTVLDDSILSENTCDADGCNDCSAMFADQCCSQFWVRADYLLWWTRGSNIPPLVTTSTNPDDNGVIGQPTTEILYGGSRQNSDARSSMRITLGYWFDCCQSCGIQFDYFNLGSGDNGYSKDCKDGELVVFPIHRYYPPPEGEAAELICKDGVQQGRTRIDSGDYFDSFGIANRWNIYSYQPCCYDECCDDTCGLRNRGSLRYFLGALMKHRPKAYRVDLIGGYRNYNLDDLLGRHEHFVIIQKPGYPPGSLFDIQDSFRASNEFHGGELGIITTSYHGCWSLELLAKVALGNNSQSVSISGHTHIERPDQSGHPPLVADYDAGVLALQTNSGQYHRNEFAAIPQFGVELGYSLTQRLRVYCGYNLIYWANVVRAAEQIDRNLNMGYLPPVTEPVEGPEVPAFSFKDSDFWAQGLNFGLEYHF